MGSRTNSQALTASGRRILTKPCEPLEGKPHDNVNSDLIVAVDDELHSQRGIRYTVQELLGQGTFGQVFRCLDSVSGEAVAVKVIKAQPAYYQQARVEVGVLQFLNTQADPGDLHHLVRMKDFFVHHEHLCVVFELLSLNLYEVIRRNKFRGFTLPLVRVLIAQVLDALAVLRESRIIHCDLKPENVLLRNGHSGEVKVIDFGSACFQSRTVYSYIQSRFYRSPEVILGCPYTPAIDMWSLGCLAAELFLGLPLFPGACEHDMLMRISATLGPLPETLLAGGRNTHRHYDIRDSTGVSASTGRGSAGLSTPSPQHLLDGRQVGRGPATTVSPTPRRTGFTLRTPAEYEAANAAPAPVGKSYFKATALVDIIAGYPLRSSQAADPAAAAREAAARAGFVDFLRGVLQPDPEARWTPHQAAAHPFVTGEDWTGAPWMPPPDTFLAPAGSPAPAASVGIPVPRTPVDAAAAAAGGAAAVLSFQRHAAAMAAARQQQQQQQALFAAKAAVAGGGAAQALWSAAAAAAQQHSSSLSNSAAMPLDVGSLNASALMSALGSTPMSVGSLPMVSPPTRLFGQQARILDAGGAGYLYTAGSGQAAVGPGGGTSSSYGGLDAGAVLAGPSSYSRLLPLLPPGGGAPAGWAPSSVGSYPAVLAAAQAQAQAQAATADAQFQAAAAAAADAQLQAAAAVDAQTQAAVVAAAQVAAARQFFAGGTLPGTPQQVAAAPHAHSWAASSGSSAAAVQGYAAISTPQQQQALAAAAAAAVAAGATPRQYLTSMGPVPSLSVAGHQPAQQLSQHMDQGPYGGAALRGGTSGSYPAQPYVVQAPALGQPAPRFGSAQGQYVGLGAPAPLHQQTLASGEWWSASLPLAAMHGGSGATTGANASGNSDDRPPEPGDWDPLWNDDLLRDEDMTGGGGGTAGMLTPPGNPSSAAWAAAAAAVVAAGGNLSGPLPAAGATDGTATPTAQYDAGWWRPRGSGGYAVSAPSQPPLDNSSTAAATRIPAAQRSVSLAGVGVDGGGGYAMTGPFSERAEAPATDAHAPAGLDLAAYAVAAQQYQQQQYQQYGASVPALATNSSAPLSLGDLRLSSRSLQVQPDGSGAEVPLAGVEQAAPADASAAAALAAAQLLASQHQASGNAASGWQTTVTPGHFSGWS